MVEEIKKKILITGVNGMLGQDLIERFNSDYEVYGIDISSKKISANRFFEADITEKDSLDLIFKKIHPWLIIHAAAFTNVDAAESQRPQAKAVNVTGSDNIACLCEKYNAKLIFISTDYVFDGKKGLPYLEGDRTNPINFYGQSKLEAEQSVSKHISEYIIVRTSWLFGVNGRNFISTIRNKAKQDGELKVVDDQIGSPTYTVSLAQALFDLTQKVFIEKNDKVNYGIYHVSNSGYCSWYEFAVEILKLTGIHTDIIPVDSDYMQRPAKRPVFSVLDKSRFEKVIGREICQWKEALAQYLQQEKLKNLI